eukprot:CAMPEP_0119053260 /NCGR_PEP_ID=MMETSP1177-20130426/74318_1 /TAXON_ID=2985 /ORGANISM="Ochromonas sp, Strain CCMP1899" /LENGTH=622 /DNA_ID=CAMNT_0007033171 /DNA_START=1465 /DNA_END=3330 /DNA_ORIENTATION=-
MAKDCPKSILKNDKQSVTDDDLCNKEDSISFNEEEECTDNSYLYGVRTKSDVDISHEISHSSPKHSRILQNKVGGDSVPEVSKSPPISAFKAAFLETPPVDLRGITSRSDTIKEMQSQPVSLFAEFEFNQNQQLIGSERDVDIFGNDLVGVNNEDQQYEEENRSSQGSFVVKGDEFSIGIQPDNEVAVDSMRVRGVTVSRISDYRDKDLDSFLSPSSPSTSVGTDCYPYNSPEVMITDEFHYRDDDQSFVSNCSDENDFSRNEFQKESHGRYSSSIDQALEHEYKTVWNSDNRLDTVDAVVEPPLLIHSPGDKRLLDLLEQEYDSDGRIDYNPVHKRGKGLIGSSKSPVICTSSTSNSVDPQCSYLEGENAYDPLGGTCYSVADNIPAVDFEFSIEKVDPLVIPCQNKAKEEVFSSLFFTPSESFASVRSREETNEPKKNANNRYEVKWIDPNNIQEIPPFVVPTSVTVGNKRSFNNVDYPVLPTSSMLDCDFDISKISKSRTKEMNASSCNIKPIATKNTSMTLKKEMLVCSRTIGQVDSKYILVSNGNLLMIIDQHAADERVKLEVMLHGEGDCENELENINMSSNERSITGVKVVSEILALTEGDIFILTSRSEIFHNW